MSSVDRETRQAISWFFHMEKEETIREEFPNADIKLAKSIASLLECVTHYNASPITQHNVIHYWSENNGRFH